MHFSRHSGKHATQVPSHAVAVKERGTERADANGGEPDQKVRWAVVRHFNVYKSFCLYIHILFLNPVKKFG